MHTVYVMTIPVTILSFPFFAGPTITASVSGNGRTIAGIGSEVTAVSRSGGNTGADVSSGEAASSVSSCVTENGDAVSVRAQALVGTDGESVTKEIVLPEEKDVSVRSVTENGTASVNVFVRSEEKVESGENKEENVPESEKDESVSEGELSPAGGPERRIGSWWRLAVCFFGKMFGNH